MTDDPLRQVWKRDGRYAFEAYQFLFESLDQAVKQVGLDKDTSKPRHVSGQELLEGMRIVALRLFGPMAAQVWRAWGVESTLDWGRIVFNLVEAELLNRQETDSIDDFAEGYDLDEAFVNNYEPELPVEISPYAQGSE